MRSIFYSLLCFVTLIPAVVYGQNKIYSPLVDIPGNGPQSFEQYINFLYGASISIAALLAVVKIIIAGAKYMVSDLVSSKDSAKTDIQGAILGLLLILGAVIILEFINPQLVKRNIQFQTLPERPQLTQNSSVNAALNATAATLLAFCGSTDESTAEYVIIRNDSDNCPNPAAVGAGFTLQCNNIQGSALSTKGVKNGVLVCAYPKTGLGAGGVSPLPPQYPYSNYSIVDVNNCPILSLTPGFFCSQEYVLSSQYIDKAASNGATIVYDAEKACKEEMSSGLWADYLDDCISSHHELMFDACTGLKAATASCNTGFCIHNAGQEVPNAGAGKLGCKLPYKKFTEAEVRAAATAQQASVFNEAAFKAGCTSLGGETADTKYEYNGGISNLRCVKR